MPLSNILFKQARSLISQYPAIDQTGRGEEEEHCSVAMATTSSSSSLHLLLIFLCFSHLLISMAAAIPLTRTRNLQTQEYEEPSFTHKGKMMMVMRRMDVEVNDYPGSGANHRHTPWVPPARACLDC